MGKRSPQKRNYYVGRKWVSVSLAGSASLPEFSKMFRFSCHVSCSGCLYESSKVYTRLVLGSGVLWFRRFSTVLQAAGLLFLQLCHVVVLRLFPCLHVSIPKLVPNWHRARNRPKTDPEGPRQLIFSSTTTVAVLALVCSCQPFRLRCPCGPDTL
jgi:hypothetical protein